MEHGVISQIVFFSILSFCLAFFYPKSGLALLIVSILVAPNMELMELGSRVLIIRISDIILAFLLLGWLARSAIKRENMFLGSPVNIPILLFSILMCVSTYFGIYKGLTSPAESLVFLVKRIQYFVIFWVTYNNCKTIKQVKTYVIFLLLGVLAVDIYAIYQRLSGTVTVNSTFGEGQANVLGGFLLFMLFIIIGLLFINKKGISWPFLIILLFTTIPVYLFTNSRASYLAFFIAFILATIIFRKYILLSVFLLFLYVLFSFLVFMPYDIIHGLYTISSLQLIGMDSSLQARFMAWKLYWPNIVENFFIGHGLGSVQLGFVDNQYIMELLDTGILGLLTLIWIFVSLIKVSLSIRKSNDLFIRAISFGFFGGLLGLIIQAMTITNFYTIKTMEPFWFLVGLVVALYRIDKEREKSVSE